jgi:serine phosphatase RsbU (regulator of sigma subunit)
MWQYCYTATSRTNDETKLTHTKEPGLDVNIFPSRLFDLNRVAIFQHRSFEKLVMITIIIYDQQDLLSLLLHRLQRAQNSIKHEQNVPFSLQKDAESETREKFDK